MGISIFRMQKVVVLDSFKMENARNDFFQEKVIQQQQKLAETKQALNDALHKQDKTNEELEHIKKEKSKLSETVF